MKLISVLLLLALSAGAARADFIPQDDTIRVGHKTSSNPKKVLFDVNQGANNPNISVSPTTSAMTATSGTGAVPFTFPTNTPSSGQVVTATNTSGATAWQATTGVLPGTSISFAGPLCPSGYLTEDGSAISRTTYSALFNASTIQTTGTTNSTTTITGIPSTTGMAVGMAITGSGIPTGAKIATVASSTSITITAAATTSVSNDPIIVYAYGAGDGSTTFNIANLQGVFQRGAGSQTISSKTYSATMGASSGDTTALNGLTLHDPGHVHQTTTMGGGSASGYGASMVTQSGNGSLINSSVIQMNSATTGITLTGDTETRPAAVTVLFCVKT